MPSRQEQQFRETLAWLLDALDEAMPEQLWSEAWEHCYRHDGQGATLCFGGPLRDDLMIRLLPWLDAEAPEVAQRLRAAYAPQLWPGPLHQAVSPPPRPAGTTQRLTLFAQE